MDRPPKRAQQLLNFFSGKAEIEDIRGDLDELYYFHLENVSKRRADRFYWRHVLSLLFSYGLNKRKKAASYAPYYSQNSTAMIRNYFKIAIRNFAKHKLFTSLNIFGLALGMSICLIGLTMAVTVYQLDEFHKNKHRTFQINTQIDNGQEDLNYSSTFNAAGYYLHDNYPFVEQVVNIRSDFKPVVNHHGHDLSFNGYYADDTFFDVFTFDLVKGNSSTCLTDPFSVVLTEKTAEKLFRDRNPMGQTLETDMGTFTVTGIIKNLKQTHFYFEMLTSYSTFQQLAVEDPRNDWLNYHNHYTYVMLKEDAEANQLEDALALTTELAAPFHPGKNISLQAVEVSNIVPLRWNNRNSLGVGWDRQALIFFMAVGILILLPAVFNHTNLSIARSLQRAKEIGVRKVVGAQKGQIKAQFIVETVLMAAAAMVVSLLVMVPMKEAFMDMVYFTDVINTDLDLFQVLVFFGFAILVGLFAGIFPAQYFSRLTPTQTLKGSVLDGKNGVSGFKKGLFVFQFFLSLVFIIGVGAIAKQYQFVMNNSHGFQAENVLTIPFFGIDKQLALNELGKHRDVKSITASSTLPGLFNPERIDVTSNDLDTIPAMQVYIADQFTEHLHMELVWGDSESIKHSNQTEELVLVNEQFIQSLKVFDDQKDTLRFTLNDGTKCRVAGILKDFNFEPMMELISPMMMRHSLAKSNYALLTVSSNDMQSTITELESIWTEIDQEAGFDPTFLETEIEEAYFIMVAQIKTFSALGILAITISVLGLLGMVSYNTENRTKEIAIRKIMGATRSSLYYLLTKDFIKLIVISAMLAIPFSYVFYDKVFLHLLIRYGTGLGVAEVVISLLFLFIIGAAAIHWQTSKVTKANPATKLRYE